MTLNSRTQRFLAVVAVLLFVFLCILYLTQHQQRVRSFKPAGSRGFLVLSGLQNTTSITTASHNLYPFNKTIPTTVNDTETGVIEVGDGNKHLTFIHLTPGQRTWKPGTFCDNFIGRTFRQRISTCGSQVSENDGVRCLRNPESNLMVRCSIRNLAINPKRVHVKFYDCEKCNLGGLNAAWLLDDGSCPDPTISALDRTTEDGDYQRRIMHEILKSPKKPASECQKWMNKTVFILTTHPYHIYFRFLSYFNLHKAILDTVGDDRDTVVLRLSDKKHYMFLEYEKWLFPQLITLNDLPDATVCFSRVIFAPWTYSATPFRCKMESSTKGRCLECNGRQLYGTAFMSFRQRVISACSLVDETPKDREERERRKLVVILRKPYHRWDGDFDANFQRVLTNQDQVINVLKREFPLTDITTTYMEKIPPCDQVRMVHDADVLMGVHGAGLVHAWWLQEDALLFELVPTSMIGNPSFKTLTKLSGRRYVGFTISSGIHQVTADPGSIVKKLKEVSNLK